MNQACDQVEGKPGKAQGGKDEPARHPHWNQ
jgi:hypothetical protein